MCDLRILTINRINSRKAKASYTSFMSSLADSSVHTWPSGIEGCGDNANERLLSLTIAGPDEWVGRGKVGERSTVDIVPAPL